MDRPWRIEMLGGLRAARDEQVVARFRTQKAGALLAYLAYYGGRPHSREELIERYWPEAAPVTGRHNLSMALSSLRRQLEPPGVPAGAVLVTDRVSVRLNAAACVTDAAEFEAALRVATRAIGGLERIQRLEAAVELYRGMLLPGYFDEWIVPERERLAEAFLQAMGQLIGLLEEAGDLYRAVQFARRSVAAEPLREEGQRDLIRLLAAVGQPEAALRHYRELERLLELACGASPAPETCALAAAIGESASGAREETARSASLQPFQTPAPVPTAAPLPTGTVTFLVTELPHGERSVERTAPSEDARGGEGCGETRERCLERLRSLLRSHGGCEVRGGAETLTVAFGRASDALAAAVAFQRLLMGAPGPETETREAEGAASPGSPFPTLPRAALYTGEVRSGEAVEQSPTLRQAVRLLLAAHPGQILLSEKSAVLLRDAPATGMRLVDLGLYQFQDQAEPERLFQALHADRVSGECPRPNAPPGHVSNLPLQFTPFFGRATELARLSALLLPDGSVSGFGRSALGARFQTPNADRPAPNAGGRLVTLTGPGGCGKTRLALEAARSLRERWREAVWFVPLADLTEPNRIADMVRDALRLPRDSKTEPLEQVVAFLSNQPSLLLIDNLEHLLPEGAAALRTLRARVRTLTLLVTSRQRLGLTGEREFPVAPLPVPDLPAPALARRETEHGHEREQDVPIGLIQYPSVQLFVDRAQAARPDFQVTPGNAAAVAALCRRLEGLPLALVLVAARAQVLAPAQMLARLSEREGAPWAMLVSRQRDAVPRHRSLRAALDWSYDLLSPELQRFFARLSIFRGGWTLEAAAAVLDFGLPISERGTAPDARAIQAPQSEVQNEKTLESLQRLRDGSLIVADEAGEEIRYRLLETLREYAAEQLAPEERAALARRHAEYYLALSERAEACWLSSDQKRWLERLEADYENLSAVMAWSQTDAGAVEFGLRVGGALRGFWGPRGYSRVGREQLSRLLASAGEARTPARAKALATAGSAALAVGAMEEAHARLTEALAVARECNEKSEMAYSLQYLGQLAVFRGDYAQAGALLEEGRVIAQEVGNSGEEAGCLNMLGHVARYQGDYVTARSLFEDALALQRALGDQQGIAVLLKNLSLIARYHQDYDAARSLAEEGLAFRQSMGDRSGTALSLLTLGNVLEEQGDLDAARARYEESLAIRRELGIPYGTAWSLALLGRVTLVQGDREKARSLYQESLVMRRDLVDRRGIAECLEGLAGVTGAAGQPQQSARLLGAAQALRDAIGSKAPPAERREQQQQLAALRETLGEAAFATAWEAGRSLRWEQAAVEALGESEINRPPSRGRDSRR